MGKDLNGKELGRGLRQRKDGRYELRVVIDGISVNLCKKSLSELKRDYAAIKKDSERNIKYLNYTLSEWFEEWFTAYKIPKIKETSINPMRNKVKSIFLNSIGDKKLIDITNIDIQNVCNSAFKEGRATSSIKDALGRLRECMESAVRNRIISINPCYDIIVPDIVKRRGYRFLSKEEERIFLEEAKETSFYYELLGCMFCSGMRIGEVCGLKWSDINFKKQTITINRSLSCQYEEGVKKMRLTEPKTLNSKRVIPFMGGMKDYLLAQREKQEALKISLGKRYREMAGFEDLVFCTNMGSPTTRYHIEKAINKIVENVNKKEVLAAQMEEREPDIMERLWPHAIRHTFCSRCFESDIKLNTIQKLLGHGSSSVTADIYLHITKEKFDSEIMKFGA